MKNILIAALASAIVTTAAHAAPINSSKVNDTLMMKNSLKKISKNKLKGGELTANPPRKESYIEHYLNGSEEVPLTPEEQKALLKNRKSAAK